ncbi:MAG: tetratricopeptide repeat protein, partial [Longimicrobiales bacterium]
LGAIERAIRFEDRLSEVDRELAYGGYHSIRREHAQSAAAYERLLKLDSHHFAALNNLALEHERLFDYARAEGYLRRAIEADTGRFFGYTNLGELLVFRGRIDEARQAFEAAVARAPDSAWPLTNLAVVPFTRGEYAEAETNLRRLIDDVSRNTATRNRAEVRLGHLLLIRGRLAESERRAEAFFRATGNPRAVELRVASHRFVANFSIRRRPDLARETVRQQRALVGDDASDPGTLVEIAAGCAFTGDVPCAREYLARAGHTGPLQPWTDLLIYDIEGAIALAEQDFAKALRHVRGRLDRRCPGCEESLVGRVFEQMQQPDSAIAAYERYLATPSVDRIFADAYDLVFVHERLGALYEARNDRVYALRHYGQVVELWKDADQELQPRVAGAQRRIELLRADR